MRWSFWVACIFLVTAGSCLVFQNPYKGLAPGMWRGVLLLDPIANIGKISDQEVSRMGFEEAVQGELPFNFEVQYRDEKNFYLEIINGEERIRVEDIIFGRNPSTAKDTVLISFPVYESFIRAQYENNALEGEWVVTNRGEDYRIPFKAWHGKNYRFTQLRKMPLIDLNGRWQARFKVDSDNPYNAVGEFEQTGNQLRGTFLTETGDYRFLDGTIQGDKLYLSTFDGTHAFLFEAKIQKDSSLIGSFYSGKHYKTIWEARKNPNARLVSPDSITSLVHVDQKLSFSFENTNGEMISIDDEKYKGKVKLVQIMGTWSPNCMDETKFLLDFLRKNEGADLEVISLAFEKHREKEKAFQAIRQFKEHLGINYEVLLAGFANKKEVSEVLNMLNKFSAYPTLIVVGKNNMVLKIYTGFSGPATSEYERFKQEFENFVNTLL